MKTSIIEAIDHKNSAVPPWNIELTAAFARKVAAETGCADPEVYFENHMLRAKYKRNVPIGEGLERDIFGVIWEEAKDGGDVGNIKVHPLEAADLDDFAFPPVCTQALDNALKKLSDDRHDRFRMFSYTMSLFERGWSLRGMVDFLIDMQEDEPFTYALLEKVEEHILSVLDIALRADFEALYFGDDWGQQQGLIMGPPLWRKYIKPIMARIIQKAKSAGKYFVLHSCGDLRDIFPDLIEIGVDVYNTVQPEIYDLEWMKREYGKDITFYGGISTQQFLPYASPSQCYDQARRVLDIMYKDGGYILSPTHAATPDIPVQNILAIIRAAKAYC